MLKKLFYGFVAIASAMAIWAHGPDLLWEVEYYVEDWFADDQPSEPHSYGLRAEYSGEEAISALIPLGQYSNQKMYLAHIAEGNATQSLIYTLSDFNPVFDKYGGNVSLAVSCYTSAISNIFLFKGLAGKRILDEREFIVGTLSLDEINIPGLLILSAQGDDNQDGYINCEDGIGLTYVDFESLEPVRFGSSIPVLSLLLPYSDGLLLLNETGADQSLKGPYSYIDLNTFQIYPAVDGELRARAEALLKEKYD